MADAFSDTIIQDAPLFLRELKGAETGRAYVLAEGTAMIIGRNKDCDILIDPSDTMVSRKHARITQQGGAALLEDLGSGNGTYVGEEKIVREVVQPGAFIRVGGTSFVLEQQGTADIGDSTNLTMYLDAVEPSPKKSSKRRILLLSGLLLCLLVLLFVMFSGGRESRKAELPEPVNKSVVAQSQQAVSEKEPGPAESTAEVNTPNQTADTGASETSSPAPGKDSDQVPEAASVSDAKKASQDHFRQGRFFYNTGNLEKAVEEWNRAYTLDPENQSARKMLLRAEQELDEQIDAHYRRGLKAKKYMRYQDAINEFKLVVKWCRDTQDERYLDAKKQLEELKDK